LLVALGIRRDGQKVLLAVRNMGGCQARVPHVGRCSTMKLIDAEDAAMW
jgi:hypothetical protein